MLLHSDGTITIPFSAQCKDSTILDSLEDWGGFTAQQGALICNRGYSVFRHRLAALYRRGKVGSAGRAAIYDRATAFPRFYIPVSRELGSTSILHEYELTQIRLAWHLTLKRRGEENQWFRRNIAFDDFDPDAIHHIRSQAWHGFAEELERSRASNSRPSKADDKLTNSLFRKAAAFIRFRAWYLTLKPDVRPWRDINDFHLNFTLPTETRLENWLHKFATEQGNRFNLRTLRFSTYDRRLADPLGSIFYTPRDFELGKSYSLFD